MNKEIIITAAVTGSRPTKEQNPAVPYTPQEIIAAAIESYQAGAAIAHIHVRDPQTGAPAFNMDYFREILEGIREKTDMIVNLTTSGLFIETPEAIKKRLGPIYLRPDLASLDVGSMNFQDKVFVNPPEWGKLAAKTMQEQEVKPEIEIFELGHLAQSLDLMEQGLINKSAYFQLCMGVKWGIPATESNLIYLKNQLPMEAVWSVLGIGSKEFTMASLAIDLGGHVRVGFEDNIYIEKGVLAKSNAQLVEKAVNLAVNHGRNPVSTAEARKILGI